MSQVLFSYDVDSSVKANDLIRFVEEEWEGLKSEAGRRELAKHGLSEFADKELDEILTFETEGSAVLDPLTLSILSAVVGGVATKVAEQTTSGLMKALSDLWDTVLLPRIQARYGVKALTQKLNDEDEDK